MEDVKVNEIQFEAEACEAVSKESSVKQEVKFKKSKIEIALYVAAIIMGLFGCYMAYTSIAYLVSYAGMYGMSLTDMMSDVIQYTLTQCFSYFAFAVVTAGIGAVYGQLAPQMIFEIAENSEEKEIAEDEACEECEEFVAAEVTEEACEAEFSVENSEAIAEDIEVLENEENNDR